MNRTGPAILKAEDESTDDDKNTELYFTNGFSNASFSNTEDLNNFLLHLGEEGEHSIYIRCCGHPHRCHSLIRILIWCIYILIIIISMVGVWLFLFLKGSTDLSVLLFLIGLGVVQIILLTLINFSVEIIIWCFVIER